MKPEKSDDLKTLVKLFKVKRSAIANTLVTDKVRNILNDEPQADEVIKLLETDFR